MLVSQMIKKRCRWIIYLVLNLIMLQNEAARLEEIMSILSDNMQRKKNEALAYSDHIEMI